MPGEPEQNLPSEGASGTVSPCTVLLWGRNLLGVNREDFRSWPLTFCYRVVLGQSPLLCALVQSFSPTERNRQYGNVPSTRLRTTPAGEGLAPGGVPASLSSFPLRKRRDREGATDGGSCRNSKQFHPVPARFRTTTLFVVQCARSSVSYSTTASSYHTVGKPCLQRAESH